MSDNASGRLSIFQSCSLRDARLGNVHIMALAMLGQYANNRHGHICWAHVDTMAKQRGVSKQAMSKALTYLKQCGYIEVRKVQHADGGWDSNRYRLLLDYELPEEFDRSLDPDDTEGPSDHELAEAGMDNLTLTRSQPEIDPQSTPRLPASQSDVDLNVLTNNEQVERQTGTYALDSSRAIKGVSLAPLLDAFRGAGGHAPTVTGPDIGAAQLLMRHYEVADIVLCWREIESGLWGNQYDRDNLSFRLLASNNKVANWERQRKGVGTNGPQNPTRNNPARGARSEPGTYQQRMEREPGDAQLFRPRVPREPR